MSQECSDSGLLFGVDCSISSTTSCTSLEIMIPDLNTKRSMSVSTTGTIGMLKNALISSLSTDLKDSLNYGLFIPPTLGKAGKFLLEERTLAEYGLQEDNSSIELRYKRRLYRTTNLNAARLKKLHSKSNLKAFLDYVGEGDLGKVTKMLNKGLDPNYQLKETGETPLIRACSLIKAGEMIKTLVDGGAYLDYRHRNGHTPLHAAAILGNVEAMKILLDLGQSPNTVDLDGLTPLYHATVRNTEVGCAEWLLFDYAVIGIEDENGLQEIHQACRFGHVQHLELLLQYSADIDSQTSKNGNTPLHICAYLNQESCARLLLFRGANRSITNRAGHTPHQQALLSNHNAMAVLIQYYKDEDVIIVKPNAKYNEKRKQGIACVPALPRSHSANALCTHKQSMVNDGTDTVSRVHPSSGQQSFTMTRAKTVGKLAGSHMAKTLSTETCSLYSTKRFSRSFNNLAQRFVEPDQLNNAWEPYKNASRDMDTVSSCSGPAQRKAGRNKNKKDSGENSRNRSNSRRSNTDDLKDTIRDIDMRFLPRMVALQRSQHGFGFVIRGLKAATGIAFVPSQRHPALQYMEEVEPGSVAARAGILKGDYIVEINNQSVVCASHEETVRLIKASGNILAMKVITAKGTRNNQLHNCFDPSINHTDDSSDVSSINSYELLPQNNTSTFTRSSTRPSITTSTTSNELASSVSSMPHYNPLPTSCFKPLLPMSDSVNTLAARAHRIHITAHPGRPDSIVSTDSLYPMPPPLACDFYPRQSTIDEENADDRTTRPPSANISEPQTRIGPPPPPPPLRILKPVKPILKSPPTMPPPSLGCDNHSRNAIAKRQDQLEHSRTTLSTLKQNHVYSPSLSNRWIDPSRIDKSSNAGANVLHNSDDNTSQLYLV